MFNQPKDNNLILKLGILGILLVLLISSICYYCFHINFNDYLSRISLCPFHLMTGIPCPGCGISRAMILLSQFKIIESLKMNYLAIFLLLAMLIYLFLGRIPLIKRYPIITFILLIIVIALWIHKIILSYLSMITN